MDDSEPRVTQGPLKRAISRRQLLQGAAAAALGVVAAACAAASPPAAPTQAPAPAGGAPAPTAAAAPAPTAAGAAAKAPGSEAWLRKWPGVKLVLSSHIGPATDAYQVIAKQFEEKTGAQVTVLAEPWTDLLSKHLADFAAGTAAYDIVTWPYLWMGHYVEGKMVEDLDQWFAKKDLADPNYGMDDCIPTVVDVYGRYSIAGFPQPKVLWGVPYKFDIYLSMYRKDLLEAVGVSKPPETYAELKTVAEKLKAKNPDIAPVTLPLAVDDSMVSTYLAVLCSYGGAVPNPWFDQNQYPTFQAQPGIDAINAIKDLMPYMTQDVLGMDYDAVNAQVQQGLTAYAENWNAYLPNVLDRTKSKVYDQIAFDLTPGGPSGRPQGLGGWSMSLYSPSKNKDAAFQLLQFLSGKEQSVALALAGGSVARYSVAADPEVLKAFPYYPLLLKAMEKVSMRGSDRSWATVQRTIGVDLNKILAGADAKTTLIATAAQVYDQEKKAGYHPEKTGPVPS